jgi:hypothetical protein
LKQSAIYSDCDGTKSCGSFVPLDAERFDDQPRGRSAGILLLSGHEASFTHSIWLEATGDDEGCISNLSRFIFDAKRLKSPLYEYIVANSETPLIPIIGIRTSEGSFD